MLSNMESDAKAELAEVERLSSKARRAASDYPPTFAIALVTAEIVALGIFAASGWDWRVLALWGVAYAGFVLTVRFSRKAQPRHQWATPDGRRRLLRELGGTVALNAVFLPLWFFARPIAVALLVAVLAYSLIGNLVFARHA
jgi:hypothetical protein